MKLTLVRNATFILEFGNERFLIDPMLAEKNRYPGYPGTLNAQKRNPLVDLPLSTEQILSNIDYLIISHTHPDHFDEVASKIIDKKQAILVQNQQDKLQLSQQGFQNLELLNDSYQTPAGTLIKKTPSQHGSLAAYANPNVSEILGQSMGFIFQNPQEKTIYFTGDTIWTEAIAQTIRTYQPDIIVLNAGAATIDFYGAITLDKQDFLRAYNLAPKAKLIAAHMEAVNHCRLTRAELACYAKAQHIKHSLTIPADGETLQL